MQHYLIKTIKTNQIQLKRLFCIPLLEVLVCFSVYYLCIYIDNKLSICKKNLESYAKAHGIRGGVNFLLNLLTVFRKRYLMFLENFLKLREDLCNTKFLIEKDLYIMRLSMDFSEWTPCDLA